MLLPCERRNIEIICDRFSLVEIDIIESKTFLFFAFEYIQFIAIYEKWKYTEWPCKIYHHNFSEHKFFNKILTQADIFLQCEILSYCIKLNYTHLLLSGWFEVVLKNISLLQIKMLVFHNSLRNFQSTLYFSKRKFREHVSRLFHFLRIWIATLLLFKLDKWFLYFSIKGWNQNFFTPSYIFVLLELQANVVIESDRRFYSFNSLNIWFQLTRISHLVCHKRFFN